jgi:hypothetical protein
LNTVGFRLIAPFNVVAFVNLNWSVIGMVTPIN